MEDQNTTHSAPMGETTTQSADAHHPVAPVTAPLGPQMINGVKVYPPSYLPAKAVLHTPKKSLIAMELEHIEGIHIAFFFVITIFLFIGMWKRPNLR